MSAFLPSTSCALRHLCLAAFLMATISLHSPAIAQEIPKEEDYYQLTPLPIPADAYLEAGALELLPDGKLAVSTRRGEIWLFENPGAEQLDRIQAKRFAAGLHEVLGLAQRDGWLYATQRGELTRLKDVNDDGRADLFETVADGWEINGDYHEYAFGSKFDRDGNLWIVLCLTGSFSSDVKYRGWCLRVSPDGKVTPTCSGLRSPGGVGANCEGEMFYTDNQGPWNGTCSLKHLKPGKFLGHPAGNRWYELTDALGPRPADPQSGGRLMAEAKRIPELEPPAVYFPYQKMGQSAAGIACDATQGKFGPFDSQLFVADQTHSTVMRVFLEKVNGHYQGACFPFRAGFGSGALSLQMSPQGQLYVGGTNRGWGSRGNKPYSLDRLVWTGKVPFEIHEMRVRPNGFELRFTQPVDRQTASQISSYRMETYTYIYQSNYGSPEVDKTDATITSATVSDDGLRVQLNIKGLQEGHVHELHLPGVRSAKNLPLLHPIAYYTLNYFPEANASKAAPREVVTQNR